MRGCSRASSACPGNPSVLIIHPIKDGVAHISCAACTQREASLHSTFRESVNHIRQAQRLCSAIVPAPVHAELRTVYLIHNPTIFCGLSDRTEAECRLYQSESHPPIVVCLRQLMDNHGPFALGPCASRTTVPTDSCRAPITRSDDKLSASRDFSESGPIRKL